MTPETWLDTPASPTQWRPQSSALPPTEEARRQVTVLFCDLVGSTALSGSLDPEELRDLLRLYQDAVATAVEQYGGRLHHTLGDGIMASWGYPAAREDDACRAVLAGLTAVEEVSCAADGTTTLAARAGIHTGLAVITDTRLGGRSEFGNLVGETPNLAARLQSVAEPGTVVISEATEDLIRGRFTTHDLGYPPLKGVSRDVRVYAVAPSRAPAWPSWPGTDHRPVIGRDRALGALRAAWERTLDGGSGVLLLTGEAGIGKSRLVQAVCEAAQATGGPTPVVHCTALQRSTAFGAVSQLLRQAVGITDRDTADEKRDRLMAFAEARPALHDGVTLAAVASLLGIAAGDIVSALGLTPDALRERTITSLLTFADSITAARPGLIIVEDAHWADPSTLELLRRLATRGPAPGALLVVASRPASAPDLPGAERIDVGALTSRDVGELAGQMAPDLPPFLRRMVIERADGVPLYAEELIRVLGRTDPGVPAEIPPRLHDLLVARLDQRPEERVLAQVVSTIGTAGTRSLIERVCGLSGDEVRRQLGALVEAGILHDEGPAHDPVYRFHHVLLRDAAYSTLLRSRRRDLHAAVASRLLEDAPRTGVPADVIAEHLEEAGDFASSLVWRRRAALTAASVAAHREVVAHLRHVLDRLPEAPGAVDEADTLVLLGASLTALAGYTSPEVERVNQRSRDVFARSGPHARSPGMLYPLWSYHHFRGDLVTSAALSRNLYANAAPGAQRAMAATMAAFDLVELGEVEAAVPLLREAERDGRESLPDTPHEVWSAARVLGGIAAWTAGRRDEGRAAVVEAVEHADTLGLPKGPFTRAFVGSYAAWWALLADDAPAAAAYARRSMEEATSGGYSAWILASGLHAAGAQALLGEPGAAATLDGLLRSWRDAGAEAFRPVFLRWLGRAHMAQGDGAAACAAVDEGLAHVRRYGGRVHEPELYRDRGLLLRAAGEPRAAVAAFRTAARLAERHGMWTFVLRARTELAEQLPTSGREREALRRARRHISGGDADADVRRAEAALDR
jgi:class 3 adenylate cyclase